MRLQCCLAKYRELLHKNREMKRNVEKCTALCISDDMMIIIDILEYTGMS